MGLTPKSLGKRTRALLADRGNALVFSTVSAWEIMLKCARGKLQLPLEPTEYLRTRVPRSGAGLLPVTLDHVLALASLEERHRDPFDRMLVAQALAEGCTLVTADDRLFEYPIVTLDARR
jgi:PIN domain nuclease of toxin-antitoxin system